MEGASTIGDGPLGEALDADRCASVVLGANPSGKSNLAKAIWVLYSLILKSAEPSEQVLRRLSPFQLDPEFRSQPCHFEAVWAMDGVQCRYGVEAGSNGVVREWLYHRPKRREALLFAREGGDLSLGRGFSEGKALMERTRPEALQLSVAATDEPTAKGRPPGPGAEREEAQAGAPDRVRG